MGKTADIGKNSYRERERHLTLGKTANIGKDS